MSTIQTLSERQFQILREICALHKLDSSKRQYGVEEYRDMFEFHVLCLSEYNASELEYHIIEKYGYDEFDAMLDASIDCSLDELASV